MVEIARSFAYKLNVGNYQSADFFCSQKAECKPTEADAVSEALYQFCKRDVAKAVNDFKRLQDKKINALAHKAEVKGVAKDTAEHDVADFGEPPTINED